MCLLDFFVVGRSPISDAVQAKWMQAVFQDSESLPVSQDWLKANHTLVVALDHALAVLVNHLLWTLTLNIATHTILKAFWPHALWVCILAIIAISTISLKKEFTRRPVCIVFKEVVDDIIIILQIRWYFIIDFNLVSGTICRYYCLGRFLILFLDSIC